MQEPQEQSSVIQVGTARDWLKLVAPALNGIPVVGSVLGAAFNEFTIDRRFKRVEEALEQIQELLSKLNLVKLNTFATTAQSMQLLESVLHHVESETSEKKRTRFCNLIVSSWVTNDPVEALFDESKLFEEANDRFTDSHLAVLM